jgi:hypothetical protein
MNSTGHSPPENLHRHYVIIYITLSQQKLNAALQLSMTLDLKVPWLLHFRCSCCNNAGTAAKLKVTQCWVSWKLAKWFNMRFAVLIAVKILMEFFQVITSRGHVTGYQDWRLEDRRCTFPKMFAPTYKSTRCHNLEDHHRQITTKPSTVYENICQ